MKSISFNVTKINKSGFKTPTVAPTRYEKVDDKIKVYANSVEKTINTIYTTAGYKKTIVFIKKEPKTVKKTNLVIPKKRVKRVSQCRQGPYSEVENIDDQIWIIKNLLEEENKVDFIEKRKKQEQLHKEMDERYKKAKLNMNVDRDMLKDCLSMSHNHYKMKLIAGNVDRRKKKEKTIIAPKPLTATPSKPGTAKVNMNRSGFSFFSQSQKSLKTPEGLKRHKRIYSAADVQSTPNKRATTIDVHKMGETYRTIRKKCVTAMIGSKTLTNSMQEAIPKLTKLKMHKLKMDLKWSEILDSELLNQMRSDTREFKKVKRFFVYNKNKQTPVCISDDPNNIISRIHFVDGISEEAAFNSRGLINNKYNVRLAQDDILGYRTDYDSYKSRNGTLTPVQKMKVNNFRLRESLCKTQMSVAKSNNKLSQYL
jgi:hypothetical protein